MPSVDLVLPKPLREELGDHGRNRARGGGAGRSHRDRRGGRAGARRGPVRGTPVIVTEAPMPPLSVEDVEGDSGDRSECGGESRRIRVPGPGRSSSGRGALAMRRTRPQWRRSAGGDVSLIGHVAFETTAAMSRYARHGAALRLRLPDVAPGVARTALSRPLPWSGRWPARRRRERVALRSGSVDRRRCPACGAGTSVLRRRHGSGSTGRYTLVVPARRASSPGYALLSRVSRRSFP